MRVNPDHTSNLLSALQRISSEEGTVLRQLASGKRIENPSDDPAGLAALVQLQNSDENSQQYVRNGSAVRTQMQMADSTLSSAIIGLERALALGVRGGNSTLNETDRNSIALEIEGVQAHMLDLANSSLQGTYLFAGTDATSKPFDSSAANVSYQGNANTNQVQIGEGLWIRAGVPGNAVFGDDGGNVFDALTTLAAAVRTGGDVEAAIVAVRISRDRVSSARVVYGNSLNQLDSAELVMNQRHLQLTEQETKLAGTDMADAATRLSSAETARNALLATIKRANGTSLFDFLNGR